MTNRVVILENIDESNVMSLKHNNDVSEPEWGGRSSAGAEWMRTDEGDSIDKRVKEMRKERKYSSSFFPTIFSFIGYVLN